MSKTGTAKKTVTDLYEQYLGVHEYDGIVAVIQEWYYGCLYRGAWCATSMSFFFNELGILDQLGGKNENVYEMMEATRKASEKTKVGRFRYRKDIKDGETIKRGTVIFNLNSGTVMTPTSSKHVTSAYEDFEFKASGNYKALGGNQSDEIRVSSYTMKKIYAIYEPEYKDEPGPEPVKSLVCAKYQQFVDEYYPEIARKCTGDLLAIDNSYGPKTRAASLGIWKYMANKYYGATLTVGNPNFYESCRRAAAKMTDAEIARHDTLAYIIQGILAGAGIYDGAFDGVIGKKSKAAIAEAQEAAGLAPTGSMSADTWDALFNRYPVK